MSAPPPLSPEVWRKCNPALRRELERRGGEELGVLFVLSWRPAPGEVGPPAQAEFERRAADVVAALRQAAASHLELLWIASAVSARVGAAGLEAAGRLPEVLRIEHVATTRLAPPGGA